MSAPTRLGSRRVTESAGTEQLGVVDVVLAAVTAGVVAVAAAAGLSGSPADPTAYLFAAGFGALVLVRRGQPVLTLVATGLGLVTYYALGLPPVGLALPVAAALLSAAEAGRLRWALGTAAALLVVSSVARVADGEDPRYLFAFELPTTVAVMAAAITIGDGLRSRRLWQAEVLERVRREGAHQAEAAARQVQAERLVVAREVHDVLAHALSVVTLHAQVADEALADEDTATAARAVGRIRAAGSHGSADLRRTLRVLRAIEGAGEREPPVGTLADLTRLAEHTPGAGPRVELRCGDGLDELPLLVQHAAYRIVQEAVTNSRQHSSADRVRVELHRDGDRLHLQVVDDGPPLPGTGTGNSHGHGLTGMSERVAVLGGHLHAGPAAGGGFGVYAVLPVGHDR